MVVLRTWTLAMRVAIGISALALVGACGSEDSDTGDAAPPSQDPGASSSESSSLIEGVPSIEELASKGLEAEPPTEGPAIKAGATVWWVSCGQVVPDCSVPAAAAKEAGQKAGIDVQIVDGKLNEGGGFASAVRTALATSPDGIVLHAIACDVVRGPLQEAKARGVAVMGVEALDCSDPPTNGESLFSAKMQYAPTITDSVAYFQAWGTITADYLINATEGRAQVIVPHLKEPLGEPLYDGFMSELGSKCPDCEVAAEFDFTSPDLGPNGAFVERLRAALLKNPDATAVWLPFDSTMTNAGGVQAIQSTGRSFITVGGSGQGPAVDLVRDGEVTAITGAHSPEWMGYAAIDNINRALQNEPTVPQGVGFRIVDAQHNLPDTEGSSYQTPIDFKKSYEDLWAS